MSRSRDLANLLIEDVVPDEVRQRKPRRKPYLHAGTEVTCEAGHFIGRVNGDLPRGSDDRPIPSPWIVDVPAEQQFVVSLPKTVAEQQHVDQPFFELDWVLPPENDYPVAVRGHCGICGRPWLKFSRYKQSREIKGYRLHTPNGWDGSG